ncbi:SDR family oxidoreductase [Janibacter cremeus]|uniref:NAD(P)-dependent dehydrogenase (Short-subunit alcohol dehydrogenase family) n=1 Tax=Janibacter cremeus TaxID=1285192 RepID=A0A852VUV9_9MICO|nr:SDR family oxidoreductase [Janibacter cremeus]NYF98064.1 NAD(P)-dependent dehydrogenase (short-subunit alcohol dehydrogenase family) [Janibacter cremeus]
MTQPRLVVVTGAARGLGRAIAERFAQDRLVIGDVLTAQLDETSEALRADGTEVHALPLDIADRDSVRAFSRVVEELGGADVLVNNAAKADGVGGDAFWELDEDRFEELVRINVTGTWMVSKHLVGPMLARGAGAIVNIASDAAFYGSPRLVHYVGSKGAVLAMTRTMARDAGPHGVRVNSVAPGLTKVEATERVPADRYALYEDNRALAREPVPADVADVVHFIASEAAGYMTGQSLVVDGGFVMPT